MKGRFEEAAMRRLKFRLNATSSPDTAGLELRQTHPDRMKNEEPVPTTHARKVDQLDSRSIGIQFSPEVKRAFADLAAAVHFSEHFEHDMREIVQSWASARKPSVHEVLITLPLIAEETFRHVRETGDELAQEAWREICNQMPEKGFDLAKDRAIGK